MKDDGKTKFLANIRKHPVLTFLAVFFGLPLVMSPFGSTDHTTTTLEPKIPSANLIGDRDIETSNVPTDDVVEVVESVANQEVDENNETPVLVDQKVLQEIEPKKKPEPQPDQESTPQPIVTSSGRWYTSSHHSARFYYHESCDGWQGLSPRYLQTYFSETAVRSAHPDHILHPECSS